MSAAPVDEVVELLRTLRLPHMRNAAPDVVGHRESPALGTRRSNESPARRGTSRPPNVIDPGPTQSRRIPNRQNLRRVGRNHLIDTGTDTTVAANPRMGATIREPDRVRPLRDRQNPFP